MLSLVFRSVAAYLGGTTIAIVATVAHAEFYPYALIGSLLVVSCYLVSLRLLAEQRIVQVAGAVGVAATVFMLAQKSAGGSVLIAAGDAGNYWFLGCFAVAALVSVWPNLPQRSRIK